jgi:hypothetical protein
MHLPSQGVLCAFDSLGGRPVQAKEESYLIKYIFFFADICVLESDCLNQGPSLVSAAIIGIALLSSLARQLFVVPSSLAS